MALPEHIVGNQDAMGLFFDTGNIVDQYAESRTGMAFDPDAWEEGLTPLDFHLAMLVHFMGTWEGSGSFVNEACDWWDVQHRVKEALIAVGCEKTAAVFDEAAKLGMEIANRYESDQDITPEQATQREHINRIANEDVSYEKLAAFIRDHHEDFLK